MFWLGWERKFMFHRLVITVVLCVLSDLSVYLRQDANTVRKILVSSSAFIMTEVLSFLNRKRVSQCPMYYHSFSCIPSVWLSTTHLGLIFIVILLYFLFHSINSCLWGSIKCNLLYMCDFLLFFQCYSSTTALVCGFLKVIWIKIFLLSWGSQPFPVLGHPVSARVYHCSRFKKYWAKHKKYSNSISFAVSPFPASKMWIATK